jgi:hypothetical protein
MLLFRFSVSPNQLACRGSPLDISARAEVQLRPKAWKDNQTGEKGFLQNSCSMKVCIISKYCLQKKIELGRSQRGGRLATKAIHVI